MSERPLGRLIEVFLNFKSITEMPKQDNNLKIDTIVNIDINRIALVEIVPIHST